jgi:glycosyltransferase involved in cell wall biosynthesis
LGAAPVNHVTIVIKSLGLGGAERLLVDALPYVDRERFSYGYAYLTPWKRTLAPTISDAGFSVTCLGTKNIRDASDGVASYAKARSLRALALLPAALARLRRLMEQTHCNLLQADLPASGILARIAGRQMGVPVVYTEHNLQERYHPLTRWVNKATYGWNNLVFAVSDEVAASIRRNGLAYSPTGCVDVRTLMNGVPVETIRSDATDLDALRCELLLPKDRPLVGIVTVCRPEKRLMDWLDVARRVAYGRDDVSFLLVGDGPELPVVRERVRELGMTDRVILTGFRADGRRLMALLDIFLMTSAYEGLPIAMLEAMALGKPVVATTVGGIPEVISSGSEGLLADAGDIEKLAACVSALLTNPCAAQSLGGAGYRKVRQSYHTRNRVSAMESAYLEVLQP